MVSFMETKNYVCSWPSVASPLPSASTTANNDLPKQDQQVSLSPQSKTFAQALSNVCDIPSSQLPKPCIKGDQLSVVIPEEEYIAGLNSCKTHLHGRLTLPKGFAPVKIESLRTKLASLWKPIGRWGMISLGKRFYEFIFSTIEDMRGVQSISAWNLKLGILRLFSWTSGFNPLTQKQSTAQCWIRITSLPQEYWRSKIIFAIASSVGTPICLDSVTSKATIDRSFGHYARVMIDLDLHSDLRSQLLVERKNYAFFVGIEYENLPDFCEGCHTIGHLLMNCSRNKHKVANQDLQDQAKPSNEHFLKPKLAYKYVPKKKNSVSLADKGKGVVDSNGTVIKNDYQVMKIVDQAAFRGINNALFVNNSPNPLFGFVINNNGASTSGINKDGFVLPNATEHLAIDPTLQMQNLENEANVNELRQQSPLNVNQSAGPTGQGSLSTQVVPQTPTHEEAISPIHKQDHLDTALVANNSSVVDSVGSKPSQDNATCIVVDRNAVNANVNFQAQELPDVARKDIRIVSRFWADDEEDMDETLSPETSEANIEFEKVLTKSQKRKLRQKQKKAVQAKAYQTRARAGLKRTSQ